MLQPVGGVLRGVCTSLINSHTSISPLWLYENRLWWQLSIIPTISNILLFISMHIKRINQTCGAAGQTTSLTCSSTRVTRHRLGEQTGRYRNNVNAQINCVVMAPPGGPLLQLIESVRNVTKGLIWFGKNENYFDTLLRKMSKVCENVHKAGSKLFLRVFHQPRCSRQPCRQDLLDLES